MVLSERYLKHTLLILVTFIYTLQIRDASGTEQPESLTVPDDSPVLLDESNVFDNVKADFRSPVVPPPVDSETSKPTPVSEDGAQQSDLPSQHENSISNETSEISLNSNSTLNETSSEKNVTEAKYRCVLKVLEEGELPKLQIMNSTSLLRALTPVPNITSGECALVVFYSPWCIFSARAAPHLNTLPKLFPHFSVFALDVITHSSLNMRYGLVAIPTLMLFYNGKAVARFNDSELIVEKIVVFVQKYTGVTYHGNLSISEEERIGPLSSVPTERRDYILILSWLIIIACSCGWFLHSDLCQKMVEGVRNNWREAEAQHEHVD